MVRWIFLLRYPDGVPLEEGERWYLGTHTQEAKRMHGLCLYRTWQAEEAPVAPPWTTVQRLNKWVRLTELGFHSWEAWREGAVERMPLWTPAPYGPVGIEVETIFIGDKPQYDLLREVPRIP